MVVQRLRGVLAAGVGPAGLGLSLVLGACGGPAGPGEPPEVARTAAVELCRPIRDWVNELADLANATTDEVGVLDDPRQRSARVLAGYDDLLAATGRYAGALSEVTITGTDDGERAGRDLRRGAERAREVLVDERAEFAGDTPEGVTDGDLFGRMGQFLISLEAAYAAAEPPVVAYDDRDFQRAVLDEPTCDHVVQPFDPDRSGS